MQTPHYYKRAVIKRFSWSVMILLLLLTACSDTSTINPLTTAQSNTAIPVTFGVQPLPTTYVGTTVIDQPSPDAISPTAIPIPDYINLNAILSGSGSTLVNPVMQPWIKTFSGVGTGISIKYSSVGSGAGRQDFFASKTDFADSDVPASDKELAGKPPVLYFPMILAGVVIAYNLPNVGSLDFDTDVVAKIFTGKITKWNDPAIAALNPSVKLPDIPMQFAVRQDSSGTTQVFTSYLSAISPEFKNNVGVNSLPDWSKAGIKVSSSPQSDGVTALLKQSFGTIGYVEATYAVQNKLSYARLKNSAGFFVDATLDNLTAAALDAKPNDDLTVNLINQPNPKAWPITTTTYVIINRDQKDLVKAQALVAFLYWCTHDGQTLAPSYDYARLTTSLIQKVEAQLGKITVNGEPLPSRQDSTVQTH